MAQISTKRLARLCRTTGTALNAGVDIRRVWERESQQGNGTHQRRLAEVVDGISDGDSLAASMRRAEYFPALTCELVDVGEQTGKLEAVLLRLAEHYEQVVRLRRIFLTGIAWPVFQLSVGILVIGALIWILGLILGDQAPHILGLPPGTPGLVMYFSLVITVLGLGTFLVTALFRGWLGTAPMRALIRTPVVGTSLRTIALSRFAWSLAVALESGTDARRSLRMALASTQIAYFMGHGDTADAVIERGGQFHEALRKTGAFPEEFLDTLEAAELAGSQAESMVRLAQDYQERAEAALKILTTAGVLIVWSIVATIFIIAIFQIIMTLYINPIYEQLNNL